MKNIKLYYFKARSNFGDLLNAYIIPKLFNCTIEHAPRQNPQNLFIGSVLGAVLGYKRIPLSSNKVAVWGTGFISKLNGKEYLSKNLKVFALRGKYTKSALEKIMHKELNIPLGDPGLLCSLVYPNNNIKKEYEWGIIPHYVDKNNENLKKLQFPNSIILDICEQPEEFLPKLLKCKKIISSAMHGLIAADSYCIPNIRMILDNKIIGGDFKYNDYYSAFGIDNHNRIDLRQIDHPITDLDIDYKITPEQVKQIQDNLIKSFPYA